MRRLVVTTVFLAALASACGGTEPGDSVTSSTADPSPSVTPSPTAEFSDIGVLVADLEAQSAEERTQFCESVYEDGYVAAAGALAAEGGFQRPDVFRTLKDVCPERVTLTIECDNRRWEATYVIDRNQPDFSEAWADAFPSQVACYAVDVSGYETTISQPVNETETAIQANYGDDDISGYEIPIAYESCVEHGTDWSSNEWPVSDAQVVEVENALLLCPDHPDASAWKQRIQFMADAERQADEDKQERQRLINEGLAFDDGLYRVGTEIQPGRYAIDGGVTDCYWERQDAAGATIENYFGTALRVEVTIQGSDYGFLSRDCGLWKRQ